MSWLVADVTFEVARIGTLSTRSAPNLLRSWATRYSCAADILLEDRWLTRAIILPGTVNCSIAPASRVEASGKEHDLIGPKPCCLRVGEFKVAL